MDVSKRLRELRQAKGLSQGDIELRTSLFRCYVSRVEGGHALPNIKTLEKWTHALGVTLSEFFSGVKIAPEPSKKAESTLFPGYEKQLIEIVRGLSQRDKQMLIAIAKRMARQGGKRG